MQNKEFETWFKNQLKKTTPISLLVRLLNDHHAHRYHVLVGSRNNKRNIYGDEVGYPYKIPNANVGEKNAYLILKEVFEAGQNARFPLRPKGRSSRRVS